MIHIDWMIGSDSIDIDGVDANGRRTPVFRKGEWAWGAPSTYATVNERRAAPEKNPRMRDAGAAKGRPRRVRGRYSLRASPG